MKRIINIYIFKEMVPNFIVSLLVFTFLVLAGRILKMTEWMVNHGIGIYQVLMITVYTMPYVLFYTLPMATLLASLIAFSRLNEDNETIALKSSGVSLYQLMPPVAIFSVICCFLASFISIYLVPMGNDSLSRVLFETARSNTSIGIKQGVFNNNIPGIVLYANRVSPSDKTMKGVFIFDDRQPGLSNAITAQKGNIHSNKEKMILNLHLKDGSVTRVDKDLESSSLLRFKSYNLNIDISDIASKFSSRRKGKKEMSIAELRDRLSETKKGTVKYSLLAVELQRKFSIPLACLILGIMGVPLGLMMKERGRSWGVALSIIVFTFYYIMLSAAESLGEVGTLNPTISMWLPDVVLGGATVFLFLRAARDK